MVAVAKLKVYRVELRVADEIVGTYTVVRASILDTLALPHVLAFDARLERVDEVRIVVTVGPVPHEPEP